MISSIVNAFISSLLLEMFSLLNNRIKQFIVFISCLTLTVVCIITEGQLDSGNVDLTVWILLTVMFDMIFKFIINKIINKIENKFRNRYC